MDQVFSARVLRMAPAQFGGAHGVSTINEAIIRVGSGAAANEPGLFLGCVWCFPKLATLNIKDYWANTFEIAAIASNWRKRHV